MKIEERFEIAVVGPAERKSPLPLSNFCGDGVGNFIENDACVLMNQQVKNGKEPDPRLLEKAGPREQIFYDPSEVTAAMVTCGGLCPGLNNVIRSVYRQLQNYGVGEVLGIRYGYEGLNPAVAEEPLVLNDKIVEDIHKDGGSILGTSRGPQDTRVIVDYLEKRGINILITIGGDGTQRGAHEIAEVAMKRGLKISVVAVPKTIDNDIRFTERSFGFSTAIEEAAKVLHCAHTEARAARNGIGLVKVMGRESGFIAVEATLANQEANFTLIPEVPFNMKGEGGFLQLLDQRMATKPHCLICVAEGSSCHVIDDEELGRDASGNPLHSDVGTYLRDEIKHHFAEQGTKVAMKYIDPSYIIRSVPANTVDSLLCDQFARLAVHAAMAGKTDLMIGLWSSQFIHVPIAEAVAGKKRVDPEGEAWVRVFEATGQPLRFLLHCPIK